jgi:5-methyltetrahydrofolate--homocysteine methyltransferase
MRAAAAAAARVGMPFVVTASFDTAGNTMMGITPATMARAACAFMPPPHGIGCNCGVGASDLLASVLAMTEAAPDALVIAKANCGIPRVSGDTVSYSGTPELMAEFSRFALDAGARIIGGCCGTSAAHLVAMRRALEEHRRRPRPDLETIVAALGPLVSPPARADSARRVNRRRAG